MQQAITPYKTLWDDNKANMLTHTYPDKQLGTEWSFAITKLSDCFTFCMFYPVICNIIGKDMILFTSQEWFTVLNVLPKACVIKQHYLKLDCEIL